jgi:hypothetical protein
MRTKEDIEREIRVAKRRAEWERRVSAWKAWREGRGPLPWWASL